MIVTAAAALLLSAAPTGGESPVATSPAPSADVASPPDTQTAAPQPASTDSELDAIIVTAQPRATAGDPFEKVNAASYSVVQGMDKALVGPISYAYRDALPKPLRAGLHNVLNHLDLPVAFVNFLLQGKPVSALQTVGRFAINSTVGVAGLIDVAKAKPFKLPYRHNGFANTLGYYGVKPGAYFFLPLVGPTTVRDLVGLWLDRAFLPTLAGRPFSKPAVALGIAVVRSLDLRVEQDAVLTRLNREAADPYAATRAYYLAQRQAEIDALHGIQRTVALPPKADQ
ncbi:MAG: VacJ family lipoprotein [Novosphingobium sp.]